MRNGARNPHGIVIAADFDGVETHRDTLQCVHCGGHWMVVVGSRRPHVWCRRCGGWTCSQPRCITHCYPIAKREDDYEKHGRLIPPS